MVLTRQDEDRLQCKVSGGVPEASFRGSLTRCTRYAS